MEVVLRRLLELIPTLIGVTLLTFLMVRLLPGDPAKLMLGPEASESAVNELRMKLGLDRPLHEQYARYMWNLAQGDLGESISTKRPVREEVLSRLPATLELGLAAMIFATVIGMTVGILSSAYPRSYLEGASRMIVFILLAMPGFWLGLELIIIFSRNLEWLPPAGRGKPFTLEGLRHLILPAVTLGVGTGALMCRILRSSMVQVLSADYIRTARAKGVSGTRVIMVHTLRNSLIPFIAVAGISTGTLMGGSVIVERIFNWPGLGKLLVDSIDGRDYPVVMACVLLFALLYVMCNLLVDVAYGLVDPRIRVGNGTAKA